MRHHGFRRFLIVNGHGGNQWLMSVAVQDIGFRLDIDFLGCVGHYTLGDDSVLKDIAGEIPGGHACEMESSHAYYLAPDLIRQDALAPGTVDEAFKAMFEPLQDWNSSGPTPSTPTPPPAPRATPARAPAKPANASSNPPSTNSPKSSTTSATPPAGTAHPTARYTSPESPEPHAGA